MADLDMPKTWEGAARWFLGSTLVFASGFEAVVLFWEGKFLLALGSFLVALALIGLLLRWDSLREKIPRLTGAITAASRDARLWAVLLLAVAEASRLPASIRQESWLYALPLIVAVLMFFASWKYLKPSNGVKVGTSHDAAIQENATATDTVEATVVRPPRNPQVDQDLLHLLDFSVNQATVAMLDDLLDHVPNFPGIDIDGPFTAGAATPQFHEASLTFIQYCRNYLSDGSHRASEFYSRLQNAEARAVSELKQTPPEGRPPGIDPLILRDYAISFRQIAYIAAFLRTEKHEVEMRIIGNRSNLIKRMSERNP